MRRAFLMFLASCSFTAPAFADDYWPKDAKVYIISPANGATASGPVVVKFGLAGMGVAPAGVDKPVDKQPMTGHHHLLIDSAPPVGADLSKSLPADEQHKHFGGGQTETTLSLPPGSHKLQLIMGDGGHVPHDPPLVSEAIVINVK